MRTHTWAVVLLVASAASAVAETPDERVAAAAKSRKYLYVMFYRSDDERTRAMSETIDGFVADRAERTDWMKVQIESASGKGLVKRFNASRLPLPSVFGLAPNGAVVFVRKLTIDEATLQKSVLTPQYAEVVKSLQQRKVTVLCLHPAGAAKLPVGVQGLTRDPSLRSQLQFVSASADDAAEAALFERMQVKRDITEPVVLMFAPPGSYLGTFPAGTSHAKLAKVIHGSGKCNCEKCRKGR